GRPHDRSGDAEGHGRLTPGPDAANTNAPRPHSDAERCQRRRGTEHRPCPSKDERISDELPCHHWNERCGNDVAKAKDAITDYEWRPTRFPAPRLTCNALATSRARTVGCPQDSPNRGGSGQCHTTEDHPGLRRTCPPQHELHAHGACESDTGAHARKDDAIQ